MTTVLFLEVRGSNVPADADAPLSEAELAQVEKFIADFRAGGYGVTSDPAKRDREAAGKNTVWAYRKELVEV